MYQLSRTLSRTHFKPRREGRIPTDRVQITLDHGSDVVPKLIVGPSRERLDNLVREISQGARLHDLESILDGLEEHHHIYIARPTSISVSTGSTDERTRNGPMSPGESSVARLISGGSKIEAEVAWTYIAIGSRVSKPFRETREGHDSPFRDSMHVEGRQSTSNALRSPLCNPHACMLNHRGFISDVPRGHVSWATYMGRE